MILVKRPTPANKSNYSLGRKTFLVAACTFSALGGVMQTSMLGRNLTTTNPSIAGKEKSPSYFQLTHNDSYTLRLAGDRPKGEEEVTFSGAVLENRNGVEIKDNLKWHEGDAARKYSKDLEWHRYSSDEELDFSRTKKRSAAQKRLLIAQYSNQLEFADVFELTKPVNLAYAERWGHDIVFLNAQKKSKKEANMATLLRLAWEKRDKYDQLLLLDADAMMNNHRYDITRLFPFPQMMIAQRVKGSDEGHTWNIFDNASLWNLKHMLTPRVQKTWSIRFEEGDALIGIGEQVKPYFETEVTSVAREIGHYDSAYIKTLQFMTRTHLFRVIDKDYRLERWAAEAKRACRRYNLDCTSSPPEEPASLPVEDKLTRKERRVLASSIVTATSDNS